MCGPDHESGTTPAQRYQRGARHHRGIESGHRTISREPVQIGEAVYEALDMVSSLAQTREIEIRAELECWDTHYALRSQSVTFRHFSSGL
jgi:plasmid stability protein